MRGMERLGDVVGQRAACFQHIGPKFLIFPRPLPATGKFPTVPYTQAPCRPICSLTPTELEFKLAELLSESGCLTKLWQKTHFSTVDFARVGPYASHVTVNPLTTPVPPPDLSRSAAVVCRGLSASRSLTHCAPKFRIEANARASPTGPSFCLEGNLKQCFFTRHLLGSRIEAFQHQGLLSSRRSPGEPWERREPPPKYPVARPSVPPVTYILLQDNWCLAGYCQYFRYHLSSGVCCNRMFRCWLAFDESSRKVLHP